ncbi:MAG: TonB family protein [Desulfuromonas sp.]
MARNSRDSHIVLLLLFIALSLAVHLLLLFSGPDAKKQGEFVQDEPTYIEIQPLREERETAQVLHPIEKEVETHRLGEASQEVEQEQAPEGYAFEDSAPSLPQIEALQEPDTEEVAPEEEQKQLEEQPPLEEALPKPEPEADAQPSTRPMPKLEQLLRSSTHAAADIARETRIKQRPDVARGEAVWLNMKHDLLFSFFARFKKGVYAVWNYPHESIQRGEQGTALLEIIINRDGSVEDVNLLNGSEFERLNREAIAAVIKGGPYGKLPDSYPEEQLRIKAYFHYQLGGRQEIFGK